MKTKLTIVLLALAGGIIFFANQTLAADATTNSVAQTNEPSPFQIIVTPKKSRVHIGERFEAEIDVKNITHTNQLFGVMLCSWPEHYGTDNPNVQNATWFACTRNFPIKVNLAPNESYTKKLMFEVSRAVATNQISFRVSFRPFIVGKDRPGGFYYEPKPGKIYLSDPVNLAINPKYIPDWISW
jgi:hypothetical protein